MSKNKSKHEKPKYLLMRFGGMGDLMFCTPVIHQLKKDGYEIHIATNDYSAPLVENNPDVDKVFIEKRMGPIGAIDGQYPVDLVKDGNTFIPTLGLIEQYIAKPSKGTRPSPLYPHNFTNYFRVIENNTLHPMLWPTMSSDYANTYDVHLGWAHIDPMSLGVEDRRPRYYGTKAERDWANKALKDFPKPIIMLQPYASSPVRTYYRLTGLIEMLRKEKCTVILWEPSNTDNGGIWRILFFNDGETGYNVNRAIYWPDKEICSANIRATAALINASDLLISADTCVSHLAEAQNKWHLTYYTSVPAWTRSRDYKYEFTVDADAKRSDVNRVCKCGVIGRDCPRKIADAVSALSERDRQLLGLLAPEKARELDLPGTLPKVDMAGQQPHEFFKTTPQGLQEAVKSAISKYESIRQGEAYCAQSLDIEGKLRWVLDNRAWEVE